MGNSISAEDNSFAVIQEGSSSSSRGSGGCGSSKDDGVSWFDEDPSDSTGLKISANDSDDDSNHFDVGETYDIAWAGGSIEDAIVVRSDSLGDDAGVVVFQGTDASGETVTVVWTPDFDLNGWYDSAKASGYKPGVYNTDQKASVDYTAMCFGGDVEICTSIGPRRADKLGIGDRLQTIDNGMASIRWVGQTCVAGIGALAPVEFAPGTIGNHDRLVLSQQHRVLFKSNDAAVFFGSYETLLPAKAFVGMEGVTLRPTPIQTYVHVLLDKHEVIFAGGATCETLFLGDMVPQFDGHAHENKLFFPNFDRCGTVHTSSARPILTLKEARMVLGNGHRISAPERVLLQC